MSAVDLDDVDLHLLELLQLDADRTNVDLSRIVGLSPAATLHRVRRLKEAGVIRLVSARLDPSAAGFPLQAYVMANLDRHDLRSSRAFETELRALPQVISADNVAGEMDYVITLVARDVGELQQALLRMAAKGGQRLITYLRIEEVKPTSPLPIAVTGPRPRVPRGRRPAAKG